MSKAGGSLPRGRRLRHEVPAVPDAEGLGQVEARAQDQLRRLVERAGGRFDTKEPIPVDGLDTLADLCDAWARRHADMSSGTVHFNGRPGLWHALDELYPLQDPNRWDRLRKEVILELEHRGWVRRSPPRGSGFDLPDDGRSGSVAV